MGRLRRKGDFRRILEGKRWLREMGFPLQGSRLNGDHRQIPGNRPDRSIFTRVGFLRGLDGWLCTLPCSLASEAAFSVLVSWIYSYVFRPAAAPGSSHASGTGFGYCAGPDNVPPATQAALTTSAQPEYLP